MQRENSSLAICTTAQLDLSLTVSLFQVVRQMPVTPDKITSIPLANLVAFIQIYERQIGVVGLFVVGDLCEPSVLPGRAGLSLVLRHDLRAEAKFDLNGKYD